METVYIETTIPSYLTARRSKQAILAQRQRFTEEWWRSDRPRYRLFTSFLVRAEASQGDPEAASRRLKLLAGIPDLDIPLETDVLSAELIKLLDIP